MGIQDNDLVGRFIILGCGPLDYNPPLKGRIFSESLFLRFKMDLWDVCSSKCNCVGCGNGLSVPKAETRGRKTLPNKKRIAYSRWQSQRYKKFTLKVNVITPHRSALAAECNVARSIPALTFVACHAPLSPSISCHLTHQSFSKNVYRTLTILEKCTYSIVI